jgi:LacI family transcriptional regulator
MATIKDVAREAQVSTATVSATLNNSAYVSPDLRARVLAAVERLDYAPSAVAQSLKKGRTGLLALVVADVTNPFFISLINAVETAADARGYSLMLCNSDERFDLEQQYLRRIRARRCDGLILAPCGEPAAYEPFDPSLLPAPTVLIDRVIESWPTDSVSLDNVSAALQATNYILDLGHRRIGAITGPRHVSTGADRHAGFMQAMVARGLTPDPQHIRSGDYREDRAFSVAREILRQPDRPTAFFVANNLMLIGLMRAIAEAGLNCPSDISVVSMDDFIWVNAFRPRLTTVSQPMAEMGAEAVRLLNERLSGATEDPPHRVVMQPTLNVRESCGPYRG